MRIILCALMVTQAAWLAAQNANSPPQPCAQSQQAQDLFAAEVWKKATPPEPSPSVIVISVSINRQTKLFIRARESKTFELVQGSLEEPLAEALRKLKASHRLPENPFEASRLLPIRWRTTPLSPEQFADLHRSFTTAFGQFVNNAQSRSRRVLSEGGRMVLHGTEYQIGYRNDGYEDFRAIVDDVQAENGQLDPLVAWVRRLLKFGSKNSAVP